jgi:tRNA nucleotidyltransferase (CCA-adding enzyme)
MEDRQKQVKLLEEFLKTLDVDGICDFWIEDDEKELLAVYIVLDLDWIKESQTKPGFIAKRMRDGVKEEINKWLGFDVYVGSTAKKCEKNMTMNESELNKFITESISEDMFVLRRKIDLISKILENYDSIDCSKNVNEPYKRIFCENLSDWSYSKIENFRSKLQDNLQMLIKREVQKAKSSRFK